MSEGPFNPKGGNTCSRNPENKQVNTPPPWVKRRVRCPVLQSSFLNTSFHCLPVRRSRHVILGATAVFVYLSELSPKLLEKCKRGHVARPVTFLNVGAWTTPHHAKKIPTFEKKKTMLYFPFLNWQKTKMTLRHGVMKYRWYSPHSGSQPCEVAQGRQLKVDATTARGSTISNSVHADTNTNKYLDIKHMLMSATEWEQSHIKALVSLYEAGNQRLSITSHPNAFLFRFFARLDFSFFNLKLFCIDLDCNKHHVQP